MHREILGASLFPQQKFWNMKPESREQTLYTQQHAIDVFFFKIQTII